MARIELSIDLHYDVGGYGADFIFNFQAAHTACQHLLEERLEIFPALPSASHTDPLTQARFLRLAAPPGLCSPAIGPAWNWCTTWPTRNGSQKCRWRVCRWKC